MGSRLKLGRAEFEVAAVLTLEPERSANFFNIAPRLMMNAEDVAATGLVQPGSRVTYYLYAAGPHDKVRAFEASLKPRLERGQRVDNLETGRPDVRQSIERARSFLALTALLAAILAGVAIALGTRRFVERHLDGCAVLRCLGATQGKLVSLYGMEFAILGAGRLPGRRAARRPRAGGGHRRADRRPEDRAAGADAAAGRAGLPGRPGAAARLRAAAAGAAEERSGRARHAPRVGHAQARRARRLRLRLRRAVRPADLAGGRHQAGRHRGRRLRGRGGGVLRRRLGRAAPADAPVRSSRLFGRRLRYGLANLRRHARGNAVQVASLALGLTAVLLLTFTRNDLVDAWRRAAPPDAPNRFLIGVQPDQLAPVKKFFDERRIAVPDLYPMVRARVVAHNGRPVSEADYTEERARRLVEREFNLSYLEQAPSHNRIVAGSWFAPGARELSVEEGIAQRLGWKLGDELTFSVGGQTFSARVSSLRKLRWDSMKVNFFVIAPPRLLEGFPATFVSAFRLEPGREAVVNELAARFPNLTVVDVGAALRQGQAVIDQLINAVQFVFLFALGAGLLVLYAALVATEDERRREAAVMRVYGASRAQVAGSQRAEFLAMGLLAGLLATLGAAAIGQLLARRVFELDLPPSPGLWLAGPLAGLALLSLNAWLSSRKVLRASPAITLRESV